MEEHMIAVAKRHANKDKEHFFRYLMNLWWTKEEVEQMWKYVERRKNNAEIH